MNLQRRGKGMKIICDCGAELNQTVGVVADSHVASGAYFILLKAGSKRPERSAAFWACSRCEFATEFLDKLIPRTS
jgi:hypothetical protein